jgi:hypothetical protein
MSRDTALSVLETLDRDYSLEKLLQQAIGVARRRAEGVMSGSRRGRARIQILQIPS